MARRSELLTSVVIAVLSAATLAWAGLLLWATLSLTS
jgi:hypothetical protein